MSIRVLPAIMMEEFPAFRSLSISFHLDAGGNDAPGVARNSSGPIAAAGAIGPVEQRTALPTAPQITA
jgi:hypothetical protein